MQRVFHIGNRLLTPPLPADHKFPRDKQRQLLALLSQDGTFQFESSSLADPQVIKLAHHADYVDQFLQGSVASSTMRRIGFPWSASLAERALASVGGTLGAAQDAVQTGWGATLGGGSHHAFRGEGAGFCVFNDIAVAIQLLREKGLARRAAVIDLDVHQGDGTAEIFTGDPGVMTLSIHCRSNFPFRKQRSTIDIDLADKVEDDAYLRSLEQVLPEIFAFRPDIVFYQSGVDPLHSDSLGHLSLTFEGLKERDRMVMQAARDHKTPFVLTLGGGYAKPIELSVQAHANTYRTAWQIFKT
ncbi:MAG TPA: histone deacetylase [Candidatus Angelobacter sp.]|nr:histone deacetylase [Candidatus Angelobacter sp.]